MRRCRRRWVVVQLLVMLLLVVAASGCRGVRFYGQAVKGHCSLLLHRQPIQRLLADSRTPADLRESLQRVLALRTFAESELALKSQGHYVSYVAVDREFVLWNVQAAPEFSLEAKTWWYPFVGAQDYRGYFAKHDATDYAADLAREGYDVSVEGVDAYSSLGWFKDPVLSTFARYPESRLAELLFHELSHQVVYVGGDTDFNEAFATAVSIEGVKRWFQRQGRAEEWSRFLRHLERERTYVRLMMDARRELETVYTNVPAKPASVASAALAELRRRKAAVLDPLRERLQELQRSWHGTNQGVAVQSEPLNNAVLNSVAMYYSLVPGFQGLLGQCGNDLPRFYHEVRALGHLPKAERRERLRNLASSAAPAVQASP